MKLLGRSGGPVYRVYGEEEYAEGGYAEEHPELERPLDGRAPDAERQSHEHLSSTPRPAALIGGGLLFAVAALVAVLVLGFAAHRAPHAVRAGAGRNRSVATQFEPRPAPSLTVRSPRATLPKAGRERRGAVRADARPEALRADAKPAAPPGAASPGAWHAQAAPAPAAPPAHPFGAAGGEGGANGEFGFER